MQNKNLQEIQDFVREKCGRLSWRSILDHFEKNYYNHAQAIAIHSSGLLMICHRGYEKDEKGQFILGEGGWFFQTETKVKIYINIDKKFKNQSGKTQLAIASLLGYEGGAA